MNLPITTCPDGAGTFNNPDNPNGGLVDGSTTVNNPYVAPELCVGDWEIPTQTNDDKQQEQYAAENLNISGAPLNVFKLLGVHEQGRLVDLVGSGSAMNGTADAFDEYAGSWMSDQMGIDVLTTPAWIGYDFGTLKTSFGQEAYSPAQPNAQHITSFRIVQPTSNRRALQVRVERSTGRFKVDPTKILYTGTGNGSIQGYTPGVGAAVGTLVLAANSATNFTVLFTGATTEVVGVATVGVRFNSLHGSFTVAPGSVPFENGDMFSMPVELDWYRVDVVNLPDNDQPTLIRVKQSTASRFWRLVPTVFSGVMANDSWEVDKLELFDFQTTRLDDIQDQLYMENRDRDYAKQSIQFKVAYQPFDAISDLSKFGFQISDTYSFTTVFSTMVKALGRPVVVGDIIELPSEVQYDHNLRPVRKFLEITDTSWASDGYTTSWRPITFKFQASPVLASQENRDILGTADTQKYVVDDGKFFEGIEQIQIGQLTATEANAAEAALAVPEKGSNVREVASGKSMYAGPGSYDGKDMYTEDAFPPDGKPYDEGFKLPAIEDAQDGNYFRKIEDPRTGIPARLYRFSAMKNRWLFVEQDRRGERSALRPSQREMFRQTEVLSPTAKSI